MAFVWVRALGGAEEEHEEVLLAAVSVTKGDVVYGASGYATNATIANCKTSNIIGVAAESVDNSGGSAGDKVVLVMTNPLNVYEAPTAGTLSQSQVWTNVDLADAGTIDEDDPKTNSAGVVKIRARVSASKALVSLNYASPTEA